MYQFHFSSYVPYVFYVLVCILPYATDCMPCNWNNVANSAFFSSVVFVLTAFHSTHNCYVWCLLRPHCLARTFISIKWDIFIANVRQQYSSQAVIPWSSFKCNLYKRMSCFVLFWFSFISGWLIQNYTVECGRVFQNQNRTTLKWMKQ